MGHRAGANVSLHCAGLPTAALRIWHGVAKTTKRLCQTRPSDMMAARAEAKIRF